jgi:hypothetical protein
VPAGPEGGPVAGVPVELEEEPVAGVPAGPEGGLVAEVPAELEGGPVARVPAAGEVEQEVPVMGALAVVTTPTVDSVPASPPEASRTTLGM